MPRPASRKASNPERGSRGTSAETGRVGEIAVRGWSREELEDALDSGELALLEQVWNIGRPPNFEGDTWVLSWHLPFAEAAHVVSTTVPKLLAALEEPRAKLLDARAQRDTPRTDQKMIAAWNGLMIEALATAARVFDEPGWRAQAETTARDLLARLVQPDGTLRRLAVGDQSEGDAYLSDYAAVILGLTALAENGDDPWHARAEQLAGTLVERHWDPNRGGFFQSGPVSGELLVRPRDVRDSAMPAGNSLAARALVQLSAGDPDGPWARYAGATLAAFAPDLTKQPGALPSLAWALERYHDRGLPTEITVPGKTAISLDSAAVVTASVRQTRARSFAVALTVEPGWHVNANPASLDFLVPTRLRGTFAGLPAQLAVQYPEPVSRSLGSIAPSVAVYEGTINLVAELAPGFTPDDHENVHLFVDIQACNDNGRCLAPSSLRVTSAGSQP